MIREPDVVDECYADKDLNLLKKLTLVIPTYNRNYYLSRCLWYHAHFPFGEIIVADSSPEEKKVVNRETVAKVREMFGANIQYLEYEPETEKYGGDIYRKWGDAVQYVRDKYALVTTDKEFLFPSVLSDCVNYLDEHPDYSYSEGVTYNIIVSKKEEYKLKYRYFCRTSSSSEKAKERFVNSSVNIPPWNNTLLFSVSRTEHLKYIYSLLQKYKIGDIRYGEIVLGYFGHLLGKDNYYPNSFFKIRDEIYINNEKTNSSQKFKKSSESSSSRYPLMDDYDLKKDTQNLIINFQTCLNEQLTLFPNKSVVPSESLIKKIEFWNKYNGSFGKKCSNIWYSSRTIVALYNKLPLKITWILNKLVFKICGLSLPSPELDIHPNENVDAIIHIMQSTRVCQQQDESVMRIDLS